MLYDQLVYVVIKYKRFSLYDAYFVLEDFQLN